MSETTAKAARPVREHGSRHATAKREVLAMTIDDFKKSETTPEEREILERDKERYKRLGRGVHFDEWMEFAEGLHIRRRLAMRRAYTNKPEGRGYNEALNKLYEADGFDTKDKSYLTALSAVLWISDDPERMAILTEIREVMTAGERARFNSPITARQKIKEEIAKRQRAAEGVTDDEEGKDLTPMQALKQQVAKLAQENMRLRERGAESLFDLKNDRAPDIGLTIAENISESKFNEIARAAKARYKEKAKLKQKPAG